METEKERPLKAFWDEYLLADDKQRNELVKKLPIIKELAERKIHNRSMILWKYLVYNSTQAYIDDIIRHMQEKQEETNYGNK